MIGRVFGRQVRPLRATRLSEVFHLKASIFSDQKRFTNLHDLREDRLVELVLQSRLSEVSLVHIVFLQSVQSFQSRRSKPHRGRTHHDGSTSGGT